MTMRSDSLAAREVIDREFGGLSSQSAAVVLWSETLASDDPAFQARVSEATAAIAQEPTVQRLPAHSHDNGFGAQGSLTQE